jgi:hypothetical protein
MKETVYEVLARFTAEGLAGCHKILMDEFGRTGNAIEITQEEAAALIGAAALIVPDKEK